MTDIPVYVDVKYTLFSDRIDLPMKQNVSSIAFFGWAFSELK